jgi:hypothetical protein
MKIEALKLERPATSMAICQRCPVCSRVNGGVYLHVAVAVKVHDHVVDPNPPEPF